MFSTYFDSRFTWFFTCFWIWIERSFSCRLWIEAMNSKYHLMKIWMAIIKEKMINVNGVFSLECKLTQSLQKKSIKCLLKIKTESSIWSRNPTTRYIIYLNWNQINILKIYLYPHMYYNFVVSGYSINKGVHWWMHRERKKMWYMYGILLGCEKEWKPQDHTIKWNEPGTKR